jgi:uncharacterized membrane-anchored protein YhcB (DUF1043 family)
MMLADISIGEIAMICSTVGLFVVALIALVKKQDVQLQQPVTVELVKAMHDQFPSKEHFDRHVADDERKILALQDEIKRDRSENQKHVSERQRTLFVEIQSTGQRLERKLDEKHSENSGRLNHVEKSIGGLERSTEMQNQQLAQMDSKITRLLERKN